MWRMLPPCHSCFLVSWPQGRDRKVEMEVPSGPHCLSSSGDQKNQNLGSREDENSQSFVE